MLRTTLSVIAFTAAAAVGCEKGACYYTCCGDAADATCEPSCLDGSKKAETCAVDAQQACEAQGGTLGNVEWDEISDLYCDSCSEIACAPEWWTRDRLKSDYADSSSLDDDTEVDGGV